MTQFSTWKILGAAEFHPPPLCLKLGSDHSSFSRAAGMRPRQYPEHCGESFGSQFFFPLFRRLSFSSKHEVQQSYCNNIFRNMTLFFSFLLTNFKNIEVFLAPNLWAVMNNDLAKLWHQCFLKGTLKVAWLRLTPWWNHSLVLRQ